MSSPIHRSLPQVTCVRVRVVTDSLSLHILVILLLSSPIVLLLTHPLSIDTDMTAAVCSLSSSASSNNHYLQEHRRLNHPRSSIMADAQTTEASLHNAKVAAYRSQVDNTPSHQVELGGPSASSSLLHTSPKSSSFLANLPRAHRRHTVSHGNLLPTLISEGTGCSYAFVKSLIEAPQCKPQVCVMLATLLQTNASSSLSRPAVVIKVSTKPSIGIACMHCLAISSHRIPFHGPSLVQAGHQSRRPGPQATEWTLPSSSSSSHRRTRGPFSPKRLTRASQCRAFD